MTLPINKPRVDYIDLLKGITILWIIWLHSDHPDFGNYRMPVFFFASGIFFKLSDTKTFFTKRFKSLVIPFLFFYVASIPFAYIVDLWNYRDFFIFDWNRVFDIFSINSSREYLTVNPPLWFLLALFFIQTFSLVIFRLKNLLILVICLLSLLFHNFLLTVPSPFMINLAMAYFGYFGLGYLMGKPLISIMNSLNRKIIVFAISLLILISCAFYINEGYTDFYNIIDRTKQLSFVITFMSFFSFFDGVSWMEFLRFYGKQSLIVLGAHLWILIPIKRLVYKFTQTHDPVIGFFMAVATAILLIPVINWMNKYIPFCVGKKATQQKKSILNTDSISLTD